MQRWHGLAIWIMLVLGVGVSSHAQSVFVIVSTEPQRPAFIEELHSVDLKTIQQIAEQASMKVFQKEKVYYLISQTLLGQSSMARTNRLLQHLHKRLHNKQISSFSFDDLPVGIREDLRNLIGSLTAYLREESQFSIELCLDLHGRLRNGTPIFLSSIATITDKGLYWRDYISGDESKSTNRQELHYIPTERFYQEYGVSPEWKSLCFYFNKNLNPYDIAVCIKQAAEIVIQEQSKMREEMYRTLQAIQDQMISGLHVPIGFLSVEQLTPEIGTRIGNYLKNIYNSEISDLSSIEIRPSVQFKVHLKRFSMSFPIEYLAMGMNITVQVR